MRAINTSIWIRPLNTAIAFKKFAWMPTHYGFGYGLGEKVTDRWGRVETLPWFFEFSFRNCRIEVYKCVSSREVL